MTFQAMAPTSAARTTFGTMNFGPIIPVAIVAATAVPKRNGPMNSATLATKSAWRGVRLRDATAAATMLPLSTTPFRNAKTSARTMTASVGKDKTIPESPIILIAS
jgi:hypothetical protein